jgi:cyanate permease
VSWVGYVLVGLGTVAILAIYPPIEVWSPRWIGTILACVVISFGGRIIGREDG